jgi:alpha-beta hydrolase superfamily lysophospholipase
MPLADPKMGILLIHGMSDSPYSLHTQAEYLHNNGAYVVGIRLPGNGTIPSGLVAATWQDMAAVVKMAMQHLKEKMGNKPIQIIGYSTGAPLALNYTFTALKDSTLPVPKSLVFYSPAIGVYASAKYAVVQKWAATLLNSDKLEWYEILPEYDPFKYGSFSINAAYQVHTLAKKIQKEFDHFKANEKSNFPPVLTFASIADDTVVVEEMISGLYDRLPEGNNTLVLFDINNQFSQNLLVNAPTLKTIQTIQNTPVQSNYRLELLSDLNASGIPIIWPKNVYSLSHVALPFSKNDPLYGDVNAPESPGIQLGHLAGYGERMVLQISPSTLLRQRWNPFHAYTKEKVLTFLKLR